MKPSEWSKTFGRVEVDKEKTISKVIQPFEK